MSFEDHQRRHLGYVPGKVAMKPKPPHAKCTLRHAESGESRIIRQIALAGTTLAKDFLTVDAQPDTPRRVAAEIVVPMCDCTMAQFNAFIACAEHRWGTTKISLSRHELMRAGQQAMPLLLRYRAQSILDAVHEAVYVDPAEVCDDLLLSHSMHSHHLLSPLSHHLPLISLSLVTPLVTPSTSRPINSTGHLSPGAALPRGRPRASMRSSGGRVAGADGANRPLVEQLARITCR